MLLTLSCQRRWSHDPCQRSIRRELTYATVVPIIAPKPAVKAIAREPQNITRCPSSEHSAQLAM